MTIENIRYSGLDTRIFIAYLEYLGKTIASNALDYELVMGHCTQNSRIRKCNNDLVVPLQVTSSLVFVVAVPIS